MESVLLGRDVKVCALFVVIMSTTVRSILVSNVEQFARSFLPVRERM